MVTTPVGALAEVFDDQNILFVQSGDITRLAEAISKLVENPILGNEMGQRNRELVRHRFNLNAYGIRVKELVDRRLAV